MDLHTFYIICGLVISGLTIYNTITSAGHKSGVSEAELENFKQQAATWAVKFDALYARFDLIERQTTERFERTQERVNDALLTMAREHPTKGDLHELEARIIGHIDMRLSVEHQPQRRRPKET